ncbi:MAG: nicotinamide-nucleotide adenylyltransferase [Thaumarchaeota archaeon]|nr:nicotinamide-nucleotide adenylyltransferase [Nitrososphaerota archaeon]
MTAVFLGRFQPFHLGHLHAVKHILQTSDKVIIAICATQYSYLPEHPLTLGERILVVHTSLIDSGIDLRSCIVGSVPNIENNALWVSLLKSCVPPFEVVFTNNPLTRKLFFQGDVPVKTTPWSRRAYWSATHVRNVLRSGRSCNGLLSPSVIRLMQEMKIRDRLVGLQKQELKKMGNW